MDRKWDQIDLDELMHYASPYYDPVKAHEYYMANRELKGRRSIAKLDDEGKEKWTYVKDQISEEKKAKEEELKEDRDKKIEEYRERAKESRERISEKLKRLNEELSAKRKQQLERIKRQQNSIIKTPTNKNLPFYGRTQQEILEVRKASIETAESKEEVNEKYKTERAKNSEDAKAERQKVASDLKEAVSGARAAFKEAKAALKTKYEGIYNDEYDRIYAENAKPTKSKS